MDVIKQMLSTMSDGAVRIVGKLVFAVIIYLVGRQIVKLVSRLWTRSRVAHSMHDSASGFITSCINIVLNIVLVLTVASVLGVPMTSIIALLGSAGLAVGLALQGGLSNFAGGVMILIFKPFEVGDYVVLGGDEGTVSAISVFYTTLTTVDNRRVVIPNGTVMNSTVTNVSAEPDRRLDIAVSVPSGSDIGRVQETLLSLAADERVTDREAPKALLVGYGSGCYNFELRVWCSGADYWPLRFDMLVRIPQKLEEAGVEMARTAVDIRTK